MNRPDFSPGGRPPSPAGRRLRRLLLAGLVALALAGGLAGGPRAAAQQVITNASLANLRTALANGGGLITLAFNGTINVTTPLQINYDTILDASGYTVNFAGGSSNSLFQVPAGVNFGMTNLTVTGGTAVGAAGTNGAAGQNKSTAFGGNAGSGAAGASAFGGALWNAGNTWLVNCTLNTNSATGGAGGAGGTGGSGASLGGNGGNGGNGGAAYGGAVYNVGTLYLTNCTLAGNTAGAGAGGAPGAGGAGVDFSKAGAGGGGAVAAGAAIYNATGGVLTAVNCAFYQNSATGGGSATGGLDSSGNTGQPGPSGGVARGGGVCNDGVSAMVNCTFYANQAVGGSGGTGGAGRVFVGNGGNGGNGYGGGFASAGTAGVTNCTFASSGALGGTNGAAGGSQAKAGTAGLTQGDNVACTGGQLFFKNTLLAAGVNGMNANGTITDTGHNLSSDGTPVFSLPTSRNSLDPHLDVFANNGGPTPTLALLRGSPAIDTGENLAFPLFDQRGVARPALTYSNYFDIGAFEFGYRYGLSGRVAIGNNAVVGILVNATNAAGGTVVSGVTDAGGEFNLTVLPGTFTIAPQPVGNFSPNFLTATVSTNSVPNLNFALVNAGSVGISRATNNHSLSSSPLVLSVPALSNQLYVLQATTNFVTWTNLFTNIALTTGPLLFSNRIATNVPYQFYRVTTP